MMKRHTVLLTRGLLACLLAILSATAATARETYNFNSAWVIDGTKQVTLPHAWNEDEAFKVAIHDMSTAEVWYRKKFSLPKQARGKHVFVEFEGCRQGAEVYINGSFVGRYENGVMAFGIEMTPYLKKGENTIEVKTDNDWLYKEHSTGSRYQWNDRNFNANYGGITKNVWLHITDDVYQTLPLYSSLGTTGIYVYAKDYDLNSRSATVHVESQVRNDTGKPLTRRLNVVVSDMSGHEMARFDGDETVIQPHSLATLSASRRLSDLRFWSWGYGKLYKVTTTVGSDSVTTVTGFRKTDFKDGMIYLNDRVIMMHGYAQRSSNEWPGTGVPTTPWLSDFSNSLFVKSGGNIVRWMHVCPAKQEIESCDRVGLPQAMPAGDAEKDAVGRWWGQRVELMRDAIIYNRNNPSIIFYECGNSRISPDHMKEMKAIRDLYDPHGGRAIGCREMLDCNEAEYGGEMLYVNKSDTRPMWMMEYCRDEALRWYWNSWSYPYHKEGDGPLYRNAPSPMWNHNNDEFAAEMVRRWYEYWTERPGTGKRVNSGGTKIVFSDTQTHGRSADNYRVSGVTDPMRIPKDAFYAHQVMWDGWVDDLKPHTYIVGHWNYSDGFTVPTVYVVSNADSVVLYQNGEPVCYDSKRYRFLYTFTDVKHTADTLTAVGYNGKGEETSRHKLVTTGEPYRLKITPITNPTGWKADGADVALFDIETVDRQERRNPLANNMVKFTVNGPAEWRGGLSKGVDNHVLSDTLRVECGITRVMLRSATTPGTVVLKAEAEGLPVASVTLATQAVEVAGGLSRYIPSEGLPCSLDRGETPSTPSFMQSKDEIAVTAAVAGSGNPALSFDGIENTSWESSGGRDSAWIRYTLAEKTVIDEVSIKFKGFRRTSYPVEIYAGENKVWEGLTPRSLGYVRLSLAPHAATDTYTIRLAGEATSKDLFETMKEIDPSNDSKEKVDGKRLGIIEVGFIKTLPDERGKWLHTLLDICDPIYRNLEAGTLRCNMPVETRDGLNTGNSRKDVTHLEALGRSFAGLAPWLALPDDGGKEDSLRHEWRERVARAIANAVNPTSPDYMPFDRPGNQPLVDAAYFAQGLLRSKNTIWRMLDDVTRNRITGELKSSRKIKAMEKNWLMFAAEVEAALLELTGECDFTPVDHALKRHEEWYKGDGWYGDGKRLHMDYYNSYVIHPMLVDVLEVMKRHGRHADFHEREMVRFRRMAAQQERLIAADGSFPAIGRSICYRTGAFHLLAQAALMHQLPKTLPPSQVRSAMTAMHDKVLVPQSFDENGWLRLGLCGHQPRLADKYVSTGSLYLTTLSFLPLGLPADDPFWTMPYADWTQKRIWAGNTDVRPDEALRD